MFVSGSGEVEGGGEVARPPVVVGEPVDEPERDEARRGEDPGLVDRRAAEPLQMVAGAIDHRDLTGEDRARPARRGPC